MNRLSPSEALKRHNIEYVATKSGNYTTACPNCSGGGYLNVKVEKDKVAWFCHNCNVGGSESLDQHESDLGPITATFNYTDEQGKRLFQVLRFEPPGQPKQFRQRTDPEQKKWSIKGVRLVPYRLPELLEAIASERPVLIVEGEKDVENLRGINVTATCNPMGAGKWQRSFSPIFNGADVIVCQDNDEPGRNHAQQVARMLAPVAKRVRLLDLATIWRGIEKSDDVSDWLKRGGGNADTLWHAIEALEDWRPGDSEQTINGNGAAHGDTPKILSKAEFIRGFTPPDYLIEGILQRRFIYALTGQTGHAKTAVALLIASLVARSDRNTLLGLHHVDAARVVYFVGENPDDVRMRVIGTDAMRDDDAAQDKIWFIPGVFSIVEIFETLLADIKQNGEVGLIIVDTSAAYFLGDEELNNVQMGNYARVLRKLTTLPGAPCVLVLCHPTKRVAEPSELLPRGGGAYLAEMDGNLTLWRTADDMVEMSYNKMRGPGFQSISFRLEAIKSPKLKDTKDRLVATVRAIAITRGEEEAQLAAAHSDEDRVLAAMLAEPDGSLALWAERIGWKDNAGEPYKKKVERIVGGLKQQTPKIIEKHRSRWRLTDRGKEEARKATLAIAAVERRMAEPQQPHQLGFL
jgi:hypothetical protein